MAGDGARTSMHFRAVDLFCGCGGFTQGLLDAGIDVCLGIDNAETVLETYRANFTHKGVCHDLTDWEGAVRLIASEAPDCNLIAGSPPCVEFSRAGRQVEGEIASLTCAFARAVCAVKPLVFIMENVPDVMTSDSFAEASQLFKENGYSFCALVRDARHCGVPQNRRRVFVVGCKACEGNEARLAQLLRALKHREPIVGVKEVYERQCGLQCPDYLFFPARNKFQAQVVRADQPYPTMRSCNGISMAKNPHTEGYLRRPNDAAPLGMAATLSVQLAACIASFPPSFVWPDDRRRVGMMLGNCVPPLLAKWVGRHVCETLGDVSCTQTKCGTHLGSSGPSSVRSCTAPCDVTTSFDEDPGTERLMHRKRVSHIDLLLQRVAQEGCDAQCEHLTVTYRTDTRVAGASKAALPLAAVQPSVNPTTNSVTADAPTSTAPPACTEAGPRELRYVMGSDPVMDAAVAQIITIPVKPGWTLHVKERFCQTSRIDDVLVIVPGQPVPFRGKALLVKNGYL